MTDQFDKSNPEHHAIRLGNKRGNGIVNMRTRTEAIEALQCAGFTLGREDDLAEKSGPIRSYYPIVGKLQHRNSLWDIFTVLDMTKVGKAGFICADVFYGWEEAESS